MADEIKKYCEGLDCAICDEKEPCIYKIANELEKQLKAKEQECEELKHKIFRYEELLKHSAMAQNTYTAEEVNIIASGINFVGKSLIVEENIKLHKTLAEIKEIVKEQLPTVNYNFAKSMHPEMFNCYEQILQKISEVEDEHNE